MDSKPYSRSVKQFSSKDGQAVKQQAEPAEHGSRHPKMHSKSIPIRADRSLYTQMMAAVTDPPISKSEYKRRVVQDEVPFDDTQMMTYCHPKEPNVRFRQPAQSEAPKWASDVRIEPVIRPYVPGEEEAYLNFTLRAFEEIVRKYGAAEILKQLDQETNFKLWDQLDGSR